MSDLFNRPDSIPAPEPGFSDPPAEPPAEPNVKPFLRYAPDRYKKDPKFLEDLSQHKSWGDVLDRMYAAEGKLAELEPVEHQLEDYSFELPAVPEFMKGEEFEAYREDMKSYMDATHGELKELAHELQLSPEAGQRVADYLHGKLFAAFEAGVNDQAAQRAQAVETLKADWKGNFAPNLEMCRRLISTFDDDGTLVADIEAEGGLSNKPSLVKFLYKISREFGEGTLVPGSGGPVADEPGSGSSAEAEQRAGLLARYRNSPELIELDRQKNRW